MIDKPKIESPEARVKLVKATCGEGFVPWRDPKTGTLIFWEPAFFAEMVAAGKLDPSGTMQ